MPRYKMTQHLTGWKVVENFIDARSEDDAWEKWNANCENALVNKEWKEIEEEYKVTDTDIELIKDYPPKNSWGMIKPNESWVEGYNKWKEEDKK